MITILPPQRTTSPERRYVPHGPAEVSLSSFHQYHIRRTQRTAEVEDQQLLHLHAAARWDNVLRRKGYCRRYFLMEEGGRSNCASGEGRKVGKGKVRYRDDIAPNSCLEVIADEPPCFLVQGGAHKYNS